MNYTKESGMVHPLLISTIVLSVFVVGLGGFGIWAFLNYQDQKNNVDAKVAVAVAAAKEEQLKTDQASFAEQEKLPTRQIVGPSDLGQVTLSYPKTWSVYVDKDGTGNTYEAYFYPLVVPPLSSNTPYALRISVLNASYENTLASYNDRLKSGALKASPVTIAGVDGMRLDGAFSDKIRGSMVLFKIRDKTLEVYTQSTTFQTDFDNTVLPSLVFNK